LEKRAPAGLQLLLGIALALLVTAGIALRRVGRGLPSLARAGFAFTLLGLAFLMVEVLVLQRTILFLGFPTLNLGLVLAVFLVAAGCGSACSTRFATPRRLPWIVGVLALALLALQPLLAALHGTLDRLPLVSRCIVLAGVLFPFAFVMGMPFPALLRALPPALQPVVPWLWGINGVASIAGSALAVAVVLETGFRIAGALPALCYLGVAILASVADAPDLGTRAQPRDQFSTVSPGTRASSRVLVVARASPCATQAAASHKSCGPMRTPSACNKARSSA
jgi:hypothetical protein